MLNWKRFVKSDWYGFAGAEPFDDGSEPFIAGDLIVDGCEAIAIRDRRGVQIMWSESNYALSNDEEFIIDFEGDEHLVNDVFVFLPKRVTSQLLLTLGGKDLHGNVNRYAMLWNMRKVTA